MSFSAKADVDEVLYVPAALAMHQRPGVPGIRSTFGTGTETLNSIRLMFSRLASHRCPNGHYVSPSMAVAAEQELVCPECGVHFYGPSAEMLAFNSQGACPACEGTGTVQTVDMSTLVPDETLTIDESAVAPWNSLMWSLMKDVCREMGVRTDIPFKDLTDEEKDIVYNGPAVKKHILYKAKSSNVAAEMDFTYYSAVETVKNALSKVKDEKGMKRVEKFLKQDICPHCHGSRLSEEARAPKLQGMTLDEVCRMTLSDLAQWVRDVPGSLPEEMRPMANSICDSFLENARRLLDLGLGYLTLDRAASTLSNGERQRMQLARAVRNRTTGVLYILDEPSIGLHPDNIKGLLGVMDDLIADGNSIVLVDHDTQVLEKSDWIIEMGPEAGSKGGQVIAEGSVDDISHNALSKIGPFLGKSQDRIRKVTHADEMFALGTIVMKTNQIHTVKPLHVRIPRGRLTVVTGVSGSGKTTMVLECLLPGIRAAANGQKLPDQVKGIEAAGIRQIKLIDATPIGINVRSTVATYADIHDELRKVYARTKDAKERSLKAGEFSYNTGSLRCPVCDGTGSISLDVQFLPDVDITCPECGGSRYRREAEKILRPHKKRDEAYSLPELMDMDVTDALTACDDLKKVSEKLQILQDLGLGYLTLGEDTPSLSGGEAQRLKLASEMKRGQEDSIFVFDEPTIGLHPLDTQTLLAVFNSLVESGATVIVIEHDLDVIRNADYIIDMGPGGGEDGGRIVACGTPEDIRRCEESVTGKYF